jgi:hypothetical protein
LARFRLGGDHPHYAIFVNCSNLISREKANAKVQMTKTGGITYDITMRVPEGTEVLFVKQIIENIPENRGISTYSNEFIATKPLKGEK